MDAPKFIEVYVQRVNSIRTPQVIGGLLDVDRNEATIKGLLACHRKFPYRWIGSRSGGTEHTETDPCQDRHGP
jgi:hypothetical protein